MELVGGLIAYANTVEARKKLRYAAVAAAFLPMSQGLIQLLGLWLHDYTVASFVGAAIATGPNFLANKYLVWQATSAENLRNQILMFWMIVMLAVSLATFFTYLVDHAMEGQTTAVRGAAVFFAQVVGFGIVWVGRFFILDRWFSKLATPSTVHSVISEIRPNPVG